MILLKTVILLIVLFHIINLFYFFLRRFVMAFTRSPKNSQNPFTQLSNRLINDRNLSFQALGLMTYLLSKPDYFYFTFKDIVSSHSSGESSLRCILKKLISLGYLYQHRLRFPNGRFSSFYFHIFESPVKTGTSSKYDYPHMAIPHVAIPFVDNPSLVNNKIKIIRSKKTATSSTNLVNTTAAAASPDYIKKKKECIEFCAHLNIVCPESLINKYGLDRVFDNSRNFKNSISTAANPTGCLVTSIKEKWFYQKPVFQTPDPHVLEQKCSICCLLFYYLDYKPTRTVCTKCEEKGL